MRHFLQYLELYLTAAGLLVTATAGFLAVGTKASPLLVMAIAATAVGVIHGCLFYGVRSRQRSVRAETIAAVQGMLKDVVNNQLQVLQFADAANRRHPGAIAERTISDSVRRISNAIGSLSEESLARWNHEFDDLSPLPTANASENANLDSYPAPAQSEVSELAGNPSGYHLKAGASAKESSGG